MNTTATKTSSKFVPVGRHNCICIHADPNDITLKADYDNETNHEHLSVYLLGHWVGSCPKGSIKEDIAEEQTGKLHFWRPSEQVMEESKVLTERQHRKVVEILRDEYALIVKKLRSDLCWNLNRAHHQGYYSRGGSHDRSAVINAIETFLSKVIAE